MNISRINFLVQSNKLGKGGIAERCDISRTTLDNLLSGADVKISTVEKLAAVLGVTVGSFFDEGQNENTAHANGTGSVAAINSEVSLGENLADHERVAYLERILEEKERLITVLMNVNVK